MEKHDVYDYVIIGGGTAGCVVASRLKQSHPSLSIAILEAGPDATSTDLVNIAANVGQLDDTPLITQYQTIPQSHMDNLSIPSKAGILLSGSSGVNYGGWFRGHRSDYDAWTNLAGHARWSYDGMLPFFRKAELWCNAGGRRQQHGFAGPVKTTSARTYPLSQSFKEAFCQLGSFLNPDFHDGNPTGVGSLVENFYNGVRQPSSSVYGLSSIIVLTNSPVHRIVFGPGGDTAIAVQLVSGMSIRVRKEVILSAGAHVTPQILMLSGIGPSDVLEKVGIQPIIANEHVGRNYFNHLSVFQAWKLKHMEKKLAMNLTDLELDYTLGNPVEHIYAHQTPLEKLETAMRKDDLSEVIRHRMLSGIAHAATFHAYAPMGLEKGYSLQLDGSHLGSATVFYLPTARGRVTLESKDPTVHPIVDPQYCSTESDRVMMREAIRRTCEVFETAVLSEEVEGETPPKGWQHLTSKSSDEEIDARIRQFATVFHHPGGTASVGKVVDADFRLKSVNGLRIVDASVMPAPIGALPQATIYALGEMAAELIGRDACAS